MDWETVEIGATMIICDLTVWLPAESLQNKLILAAMAFFVEVPPQIISSRGVLCYLDVPPPFQRADDDHDVCA